MNVCLIGDSLTSLTLAKILINKRIKVSIYSDKKKKKHQLQSRTIGISKDNLNFFNNEIIKLKKNMIWDVKEIEIFNESFKTKKIFNFSKPNEILFSNIKNNQILKLLEKNLKKSKFFKKKKIKNDIFYQNILKENKFELIINCDSNNKISKFFFNKKIDKNYNSFSYTTIIKHEKIKNHKAIQIFTEKGPIAFLPISNFQTSIVFSKFNEKDVFNKKEIIKLIINYNKNYKIKNVGKLEKFKLKFSLPRKYYYKNILFFGDNLHKIHPLAGQGFNMTIRDIKNLSNIIQNRIELGLNLDSSIYSEFEKKTKSYNFIFSNGIDFIYEFFKFNNKYKNNYSNKLLKTLGNNKLFNEIATKCANQGLII